MKDTPHRQPGVPKQNGHMKEKLEIIKSNNVDSTTDDEAATQDLPATNHNRVNLTMMVMNGIKDIDHAKSSCTSSEQDNENEDLYSDIENVDSAIESTCGKDVEKENGEVIVFFLNLN